MWGKTMTLIPMDLVEIQCDRCGIKFCETTDEFCAVLRTQAEEYLDGDIYGNYKWESEHGNHLCHDCTPPERKDFEDGDIA